MVAPRKRILRKEFRQPDRFMVIMGRCLDLLRTYRQPLIGAAVGVVVVAAAVMGWQYYRDYQRDQALAQYNRALASYQEGEYQAALESFRELRTQGLAPYDVLADLYVANSHIALNEPDKAVEALGAASRESGGNLLNQAMLVTLGLAQEMTGACADAVQSLDQALGRAGPLRQEAMLGKARCSARLGNRQEAADTYKTYLEEFPEGETVEIALRLQQLGGNTGSADNPGNTGGAGETKAAQ